MKFVSMLAAMVVLSFANAHANDISSATNKTSTGKVIGAINSEFPDWFKQSFLEIAEDVAEVQAENQHVMLYFHLEGCPYCYKMIEENFKHSSYTEFLQQHFAVIDINVKGDREVIFNDSVSLTEKDLARHLNVRYTPTIIFLDSSNTPVLRLNGYRSVAGFKHALDYVHEQAYQHTTLSRFIDQRLQQTVYIFRDHSQFVDLDDLSRIQNRPLMLLFEDRSCDECADLHDRILNLETTKALLGRFTVVRLDALSEHPLMGMDGQATTPKALVEELGLSYRPGVVLFDQGREIMRIDGMLRSFHFQEVLRYVGERHYLQYPEFRDYARAREQAILQSGQDIDVWK